MKTLCIVLAASLLSVCHADIRTVDTADGLAMVMAATAEHNGAFVAAGLTALIKPGQIPDYGAVISVGTNGAHRGIPMPTQMEIESGSHTLKVESASRGNASGNQMFTMSAVQFRDVCRGVVRFRFTFGSESWIVTTKDGDAAAFFRAVTNAAYQSRTERPRPMTLPGAQPLSVRWQFTEQNNVWWRCSYQLLPPPGARSKRIKIQFLDAQGFELDYATHYDVAGGFTISSSKLIDSDVAPRVKSVIAKYD